MNENTVLMIKTVKSFSLFVLLSLSHIASVQNNRTTK